MAFHRLPVAAYTGAATITPCNQGHQGVALSQRVQQHTILLYRFKDRTLTMQCIHVHKEEADFDPTSGMLWTAMAKAITGPMLVNDENATCSEAGITKVK